MQDGRVFFLVDYVMELTADIILKVVLSSDDRIMRKRIMAILADQLRNAAGAHSMFPLMDTLDPVRRWRECRNERYTSDFVLGRRR